MQAPAYSLPQAVKAPSRRPASDVPIDELRQRFRYDPETGEIINLLTGRPCGYRDKSGYFCFCGNFGGRPVFFRLHRLAWALHYGEWPTRELDHINRDRGDNRIANLRSADRALQAKNTTRRLPPGVWFQPAGSFENPFEARAVVAGKQTYIGRFASIRAAAEAVIKAEAGQ